MTDINKKDITFVVQGAVAKGQTIEVLKSIRKYFKESQIILSTWENTNMDFNEDLYDKAVFSKDPGGFLGYEKAKVGNNVDRQTVSTFNGLKACETKYAFKIRSDFRITGDGFLQYFDKFNKFNNEYKIVDKRMLACTDITLNPRNETQYKYPFHVSDFAFFGLTEDLLSLFSAPLTPKEDKKYLETHSDKSNPSESLFRFMPEQWIATNFLKSKGKNINCEYYNDCSEENSKITDLYIANNFVLLSLEQFNLDPFKKEFFANNIPNYKQICYTHNDFLEMYEKYCNKNTEIDYLQLDTLEQELDNIIHNNEQEIFDDLSDCLDIFNMRNDGIYY